MQKYTTKSNLPNIPTDFFRKSSRSRRSFLFRSPRSYSLYAIFALPSPLPDPVPVAPAASVRGTTVRRKSIRTKEHRKSQRQKQLRQERPPQESSAKTTAGKKRTHKQPAEKTSLRNALPRKSIRRRQEPFRATVFAPPRYPSRRYRRPPSRTRGTPCGRSARIACR